MSLNTADTNHAVLLHSGECKDTVCEFSDNESPEFQGTKEGHTYLTSHRIVFRNRSEVDLLSSVSLPFVAMKNVYLRENNILGVLFPQPNGNFSGEVKFKITFEKGGATEFIQALMIASCIAIQGEDEFPLLIPPYTPATTWYEPVISVYQPPKEHLKWIPKHETFTTPRPNSVYITNDPAPFPGIASTSELCDPFVRTTVHCPLSVFTLEKSDQPGQETCSFSPMDGTFGAVLK